MASWSSLRRPKKTACWRLFEYADSLTFEYLWTSFMFCPLLPIMIGLFWFSIIRRASSACNKIYKSKNLYIESSPHHRFFSFSLEIMLIFLSRLVSPNDHNMLVARWRSKLYWTWILCSLTIYCVHCSFSPVDLLSLSRLLPPVLWGCP